MWLQQVYQQRSPFWQWVDACRGAAVAAARLSIGRARGEHADVGVPLAEPGVVLTWSLMGALEQAGPLAVEQT
jgi:hypothetical protein